MIGSGPWSVAMDVGGWLRSLGLGQYEALFRASDIDADILPELTEVDLEKLGVSLGHRKRLLRAISGLAAASPWRRPYRPVHRSVPMLSVGSWRTGGVRIPPAELSLRPPRPPVRVLTCPEHVPSPSQTLRKSARKSISHGQCRFRSLLERRVDMTSHALIR